MNEATSIPVSGQTPPPSVNWEAQYILAKPIKDQLRKQNWETSYIFVAGQTISMSPVALKVLYLFQIKSTPHQVWLSLGSEPDFSEYQFAVIMHDMTATNILLEDLTLPTFTKPVFIVSAPRSGATLLFETLSHWLDFWTVGGEGQRFFEQLPELSLDLQRNQSDVLTGEHVAPYLSKTIREGIVRELRDRDGHFYLKDMLSQRQSKISFLDTSQANALRIPFLSTMFPGARFIFMYRSPQQCISSILDGWRSGKFIRYRELPNWPLENWSFLLPNGWQAMAGKSLVEVAAYQWQAANRKILDDLQTIPRESWCALSYREFIANPMEQVARCSRFANAQLDTDMMELFQNPLPFSRFTLSPPDPEKWRNNEADLVPLLQDQPIQSVVERAELLLGGDL